MQQLPRERRSRRPAAAIVSRSCGTGPLSFNQRGIWLSCQAERDEPLYVMPIAYRLRGVIAVDVWERALRSLVERHAALRTVIRSTVDGPVQIVRDDVELDFQYVDVSTAAPDSLDAMLTQEARRPLALERGLLFRARLFRISDQEHLLLLVMHHIVSDGWSIEVLARELGILHEAFSRGEDSPLPELPIHYLDYALWQHERLQGEVLAVSYTHLTLPTIYSV